MPWRSATVRLECGCNLDVNPDRAFAAGDEYQCKLHGLTVITRWSRITV